jgi:hypothetical protein
MADDRTLSSYRSTDPQRRTAEPARPDEQAGAGDPLAELARLIGQSDPYAEFGRSGARRTNRQAQGLVQAAAAPQQWQPPAQEWPSTADETYAHDPYRAGAAHDEHAYASAHAEEQYLPAEHVHEEVPLAAEQQGYYQDGQGLHASGEYAEQPQQDAHDAEPYYADEAPLDPSDEAMYDDPPRTRARSTLTTAVALVGCALIGSVGAYAYRSFSAPGGSTQPPPVIAADNSTPTKIVPATSGDAQSAKGGQDRVANAGKEQLVPKQEEPVALKESAPAPAPRVALPPPPPAQAAPAAAQAPAGAAGVTGEPKKVRTVTIRPDGSDASARPVGAPAPAAAATASAAPKTAGAARSGPISLDPQSGEPAAPAARPQTAAVQPRPETSSSGPGGILVQLSSQKTESEALASFRSLQAKFPNELGGRKPVIRRADLGSKGVFYRTLVGPFASAHEAGQFCSNYKAAGGQCVVPNN